MQEGRIFSIRNLLRQAQLSGIDIIPTLREAGIDPEQLANDPDYKNTFQAFNQAWTEIPNVAKDPHFGLLAAELAHLAYPQISEHLIRVSRNVRESFEAVRYAVLAVPWALFKYSSTPDGGGVLEVTSQDPAIEIPRGYIEFGLAVAYLVRRRFSTRPWSPARLELTAKSDLPSPHHARVFGCPVEFGAAKNRLIISKESMEIPTLQPDPSLFSLLSNFADRELSTLKQAQPALPQFQGQVREALSRALAQRESGAKNIAKGLGISEKTLQRRLKDEGTSFQKLLDELRYDLAESLLKKRTEINIDGIAFILGYSEPSAFYKAYRRWTGRSLNA